ncbi:class I SAM-dependent methyltransferase [Thermogemmatispora sp.]|uniref:class I SAM-dependent methyltransferase n=1 Tax=Thermogemmatispora sp. TaxID=1968838 RepID=UPI0035E3FFAC
MESAIERWYAIHDARARQMEAIYARLGRSSADYWDRRARFFHRSTRERGSSDPLFLRLRQELEPTLSVLDVGAGTGRFALAVAPLVRVVYAVEPNATMLGYLRQEAQEGGVHNIVAIQSTWEAAPSDLRADLVLCSHVLYPIREVVPFVEKLRSAARRTCYIYMRAQHLDEFTAPVWRHFHGTERASSPSYIHLLDVLFEMGIYANVEIVRTPLSLRYPSLDDAVEEMLEQQLLPDDEATRRELRAFLKDWLVEDQGGLAVPGTEVVSAIISFPGTGQG